MQENYAFLQGSNYTSDLFSMVGTVFLWLFWPSFNSVTAVTPDAMHRGLMNTYFSLCGSVVATFAMSSLLSHKKKFVMEHIQNATLAGGVAVGAVADLMVGPWAAMLIGTFAGIISVTGFEFITPAIQKFLKIHDTCGVHNLHGMPGVYGALVSCIVVSFASVDLYGDSLKKIMEYVGKTLDDGRVFTAHDQACMQLAALVVTLVIALGGGFATGVIMRLVGKLQGLDDMKPQGRDAVVKLAMSARNGETDTEVVESNALLLPEDAYFEDNVFFEVNEDEPLTHIYIKDGKNGKLRRFDPANDSLSNLANL